MGGLILRHWLLGHCLPLNIAEITTTHPVRRSLPKCVSGCCKEWESKVYNSRDEDPRTDGVVLVQTKTQSTSRNDSLVQTPAGSRSLAHCLSSSPRAEDFLPAWSSRVNGVLVPTPASPLVLASLSFTLRWMSTHFKEGNMFYSVTNSNVNLSC